MGDWDLSFKIFPFINNFNVIHYTFKLSFGRFEGLKNLVGHGTSNMHGVKRSPIKRGA